MFSNGLYFVKVLFPFQMHQVEFVHQPEFLQKVNGAINGGAIYPGVAFASQLKQRSGVQMLPNLLNHLNHRPALGSDPDSFGPQFVHQISPFQGGAHRPLSSCDLVATDNNWTGGLTREAPFATDSQQVIGFFIYTTALVLY